MVSMSFLSFAIKSNADSTPSLEIVLGYTSNITKLGFNNPKYRLSNISVWIGVWLDEPRLKELIPCDLKILGSNPL